MGNNNASQGDGLLTKNWTRLDNNILVNVITKELIQKYIVILHND